MTQQVRMGVEVGKIATKIGELLGCMTCGSGIAIGAVGERYGYSPFENWRCSRPGCRVAMEGVPPQKLVAISEIIGELPPADAHLNALAATAVPPAPDSRLPPERDDEEPHEPTAPAA